MYFRDRYNRLTPLDGNTRVDFDNFSDSSYVIALRKPN
jgi:hypothetical protein